MHTVNPYTLSLSSHRTKLRNTPSLSLPCFMNGGGK